MLDQSPHAVHDGRQPGQLVDGVVMGRGPDRALDHRPLVLVDVGQDRGDVHAGVVDVDGTHRRVARHAVAIRADGPVDDVPRVVDGEAACAPGDDEARGQALEVELERPAQGLVEVVDVEQQVALG